MWSAGVVVAKIFRFFCYGPVSNLSWLFSSTSCFPLSPANIPYEADGLPRVEGHLLESIFKLIGTPDRKDLYWISDEMAETFVAKVMPLPKLDLQSLFPLVDPAGIELLG